MQTEFTIVAKEVDIPQGTYRCVNVSGRNILLAHLSDGFFAVENRCSHAGSGFAGPILKGSQIACPLHGACFDLRTGAPKSPPAFLAIPTFQVRADAGQIAVAVPSRAELRAS